MKPGGDFLIFGGVWQQITGDLLDGELIQRHVFVQGGDHPMQGLCDCVVARPWDGVWHRSPPGADSMNDP